MASIERIFPPDLPAARGHFPGNPIVPGAVLLSETLRAIEDALQTRLLPYRITFAKFVHPLRPGERVVIEFSDPVAGVVAFTCAVGGRTVLKGEVRCDATSVIG
jgi:3-hydroxymyristoyl/3-hydroxydecanoyl-(acyl carrier protein) dehydratase